MLSEQDPRPADAALPPPPPVRDTGQTAAAPRRPQRRKSRLGLWIALLIFVSVVGLGVVLVLSLAMAAVGFEGSLFSESSGDIKEETVVAGGRGEDRKIAVLSITGAIMGTGSHVAGSDAVFAITQQLRRAGRDDKVRGVILQIDSPGGGLTASDLIHNEVRRLRQECGKPVIVWIGDMAASGGYYIAAPADHIVASPTALVGSIGVIMMRFMVKELFEKKLGIKYAPIMAGESKDLGSMFREMKPEERELMEDTLTHFHDRFVAVVSEGRGLTPEAVRNVADGRIFVPEEARDLGLVDEV
jgi:protease IV